jgi:hypothetical protein
VELLIAGPAEPAGDDNAKGLRIDGQQADIEQGMEVGTKQESVGDMVGRLAVMPATMSWC